MKMTILAHFGMRKGKHITKEIEVVRDTDGSLYAWRDGCWWRMSRENAEGGWRSFNTGFSPKNFPELDARLRSA